MSRTASVAPIAALIASLSRTSAAFASNAAIEGDCRETLPTRLPSPSRKFTHQGVVLAVADDRSDRLAVRAGIPDAPEGVVVEDHLDEAVERLYIGAIGSVISRSAVLFTVFCTRSAMGFAPLRHNAPGCA